MANLPQVPGVASAPASAFAIFLDSQQDESGQRGSLPRPIALASFLDEGSSTQLEQVYSPPTTRRRGRNRGATHKKKGPPKSPRRRSTRLGTAGAQIPKPDSRAGLNDTPKPRKPRRRRASSAAVSPIKDTTAEIAGQDEDAGAETIEKNGGAEEIVVQDKDTESEIIKQSDAKDESTRHDDAKVDEDQHSEAEAMQLEIILLTDEVLSQELSGDDDDAAPALVASAPSPPSEQQSPRPADAIETLSSGDDSIAEPVESSSDAHSEASDVEPLADAQLVERVGLDDPESLNHSPSQEHALAQMDDQPASPVAQSPIPNEDVLPSSPQDASNVPPSGSEVDPDASPIAAEPSADAASLPVDVAPEAKASSPAEDASSDSDSTFELNSTSDSDSDAELSAETSDGSAADLAISSTSEKAAPTTSVSLDSLSSVGNESALVYYSSSQSNRACPKLTLEQIERLTPEQIERELPSVCLRELPFLSQLRAEAIPKLPSNAFTHFTLSDFKKLPPTLSLTKEQMANLGSAIADGSEHPAQAFVDANHLAPEVLEQLGKVFVRNLPDQAWAAFTSKHVSALKAPALEAISARCMSKLPKGAFGDLQKEQIKSLGSEYLLSSPDHPRHALSYSKIRSIRSEETRAAIFEIWFGNSYSDVGQVLYGSAFFGHTLGRLLF